MIQEHELVYAGFPIGREDRRYVPHLLDEGACGPSELAGITPDCCAVLVEYR